MSEAAFDRLIDTPELRGDTMRLALLLIVTAERSTMIITMTRADMARRLGVQPTNVSRLMSKLTAVGLVVTEGAVRKINPTWAFGADSRAHGDAVTTHYRNGGVGVNETPPQVKAPKRTSTTATRTKVTGGRGATGTKRRNLRAVPERDAAPHPSTDPQVPGQMDVYDAGA
jgi:Crp-like helix-turn-helix domain